MVKNWKDGERYRAEIEFVQNSSSPNTTNNTIEVFTPTEAPEEAAEEAPEVAEEAPAPAPVKPAKKSAPPEY